MEEIEYLRESRLIAIETLLTHTYNVVLKLAGADEAVITEVEADAMQQASINTMEGAINLTAVQRDHLSSEVAVSLERLFEISRSMRAT